MTRFSLVRRWQSPSDTAGVCSIGNFTCFTLEDAFRAPGVKIPGRTAIPSGEYEIVFTLSGLWSPREDGHLPLLVDVPGFTLVRVHAGNRDEDTKGCILVGEALLVDGVIKAPYASMVKDLALERSRPALTTLLPLIGQPAKILIVNAPELVPVDEAA